jgi:hypothetical protein
VVEAVAPGVERLEVGDEVFGVTSIRQAGAFAEYVVADEKNVGLKPPSISFEQAGASTLVSVVAWNALVAKARLSAGQSVFITGCLLPHGAPAVRAGHVGLGPGFIDEHQPPGINLVPISPPLLAPACDVRSILFAGAQAFFEAEAGSIKDMPHRVVAHRDATFPELGQQGTSGDVRLRRNPRLQPFPLFGQCKLPLAAHWQSGRAAGLTGAPDPADRRGLTDIVMLRRRLAAHSTMNRGNHAFTQI